MREKERESLLSSPPLASGKKRYIHVRIRNEREQKTPPPSPTLLFNPQEGEVGGGAKEKGRIEEEEEEKKPVSV